MMKPENDSDPILLEGVFNFESAPSGKEKYVVSGGFRPITWHSEDSKRTSVIFETQQKIALGESKTIGLIVLWSAGLKDKIEQGDVLQIGSIDHRMGTYEVINHLGKYPSDPER